MKNLLDRRDFLRMAGLGGVVFISALNGQQATASTHNSQKDFFFVQMSDTHWGFEGDKINPDTKGTL